MLQALAVLARSGPRLAPVLFALFGAGCSFPGETSDRNNPASQDLTRSRSSGASLRLDDSERRRLLSSVIPQYVKATLDGWTSEPATLVNLCSTQGDTYEILAGTNRLRYGSWATSDHWVKMCRYHHTNPRNAAQNQGHPIAESRGIRMQWSLFNGQYAPALTCGALQYTLSKALKGGVRTILHVIPPSDPKGFLLAANSFAGERGFAAWILKKDGGFVDACTNNPPAWLEHNLKANKTALLHAAGAWTRDSPGDPEPYSDRDLQVGFAEGTRY